MSPLFCSCLLYYLGTVGHTDPHFLFSISLSPLPLLLGTVGHTDPHFLVSSSLPSCYFLGTVGHTDSHFLVSFSLSPPTTFLEQLIILIHTSGFVALNITHFHIPVKSNMVFSLHSSNLRSSSLHICRRSYQRYTFLHLCLQNLSKIHFSPYLSTDPIKAPHFSIPIAEPIGDLHFCISASRFYQRSTFLHLGLQFLSTIHIPPLLSQILSKIYISASQSADPIKDSDLHFSISVDRSNLRSSSSISVTDPIKDLHFCISVYRTYQNPHISISVDRSNLRSSSLHICHRSYQRSTFLYLCLQNLSKSTYFHIWRQIQPIKDPHFFILVADPIKDLHFCISVTDPIKDLHFCISVCRTYQRSTFLHICRQILLKLHISPYLSQNLSRIYISASLPADFIKDLHFCI